MNEVRNNGSPLSIVNYGVDICQGRVGNGDDGFARFK